MHIKNGVANDIAVWLVKYRNILFFISSIVLAALVTKVTSVSFVTDPNMIFNQGDPLLAAKERIKNDFTVLF